MKWLSNYIIVTYVHKFYLLLLEYVKRSLIFLNGELFQLESLKGFKHLISWLEFHNKTGVILFNGSCFYLVSELFSLKAR